MLCPLTADMLSTRSGTVMLQGVKVQQLQIQVIVRNTSLFAKFGEPLDVHKIATAFDRSAQRSADVLTEPAGIDFVA